MVSIRSAMRKNISENIIELHLLHDAFHDHLTFLHTLQTILFPGNQYSLNIKFKFKFDNYITKMFFYLYNRRMRSSLMKACFIFTQTVQICEYIL